MFWIKGDRDELGDDDCVGTISIPFREVCVCVCVYVCLCMGWRVYYCANICPISH